MSMIKIYIYKIANQYGRDQYHIGTVLPKTLDSDPQELVVTKESAYLLMISQQGVDALNDALGRMYNNGADHFLTWMEGQNGDDDYIGLDEPQDDEPVDVPLPDTLPKSE